MLRQDGQSRPTLTPTTHAAPTLPSEPWRSKLREHTAHLAHRLEADQAQTLRTQTMELAAIVRMKDAALAARQRVASERVTAAAVAAARYIT